MSHSCFTRTANMQRNLDGRSLIYPSSMCLHVPRSRVVMGMPLMGGKRGRWHLGRALDSDRLPHCQHSTLQPQKSTNSGSSHQKKKIFNLKFSALLEVASIKVMPWLGLAIIQCLVIAREQALHKIRVNGRLIETFVQTPFIFLPTATQHHRHWQNGARDMEMKFLWRKRSSSHSSPDKAI